MLEARSTEQELMDDLSISGEVVDQTLKELNTINRFLGGNQISLRLFKKIAKERKSISLVDLGCGGGDILIDMARWCRKNGVEGSFTGIDANPNIVEYAQKRTKEFPEINFQCINIFDQTFAVQKYDMVHCCLFTHHFSDEELIRLFRQFKEQASLGVIINDLHRHYLAFWSIKILTRLFSRSFMVRNDAAVSVARGFTKSDIKSIMKASSIESYHLNWKWAFRWQLLF